METKLMEGYCPDVFCNERLLYDPATTSIVSCHFCNQKFPPKHVRSVSKICSNEAEWLQERIDNIPKRASPEWTRINGLSPFLSRIISPSFTSFGIDRHWTVKRLSELGMRNGFEPSLLSDRAFFIDERYLDVPGFGVDTSGSYEYLLETLTTLKFSCENNLVPLHVDGGDGNCLTQAVSRALVGREIFWHPLQEALRYHFIENKFKYMNSFFISESELAAIVEECDINGFPSKSHVEFHIFALSNVLRRPIILLDTFENMVANSDRKGFDNILLPLMNEVDDCKSKNGQLRKPLVVAWSNSNKCRIVPLVAVKGKSIPKITLPEFQIDKAEGFREYVNLDENFCCEVADGQSIEMEDVDMMIRVMVEHFTNLNSISPQIISDYFEDVKNHKRYNFSQTDEIVKTLVDRSNRNRLWRCLICWRLNESPNIPTSFLQHGGIIYEKIKENVPEFMSTDPHKLPFGTFLFNRQRNSFEVEMFEIQACQLCHYNQDQMRLQYAKGNIRFLDGDHTRTSSLQSSCKRKMKHFWSNKEYDNAPVQFPIELDLNNEFKSCSIVLFQFESDTNLNTDLHQLAIDTIQANYSGLTIDQTLVDNVIYVILKTLHTFCPSKTKDLCDDPLWTFDKIQTYKKLTTEEQNNYSRFLENSFQTM